MKPPALGLWFHVEFWTFCDVVSIVYKRVIVLQIFLKRLLIVSSHWHIVVYFHRVCYLGSLPSELKTTWVLHTVSAVICSFFHVESAVLCLSVESPSHLLWIWLPHQAIGLPKTFAPLCRPIRTKTNRGSLAHVFPRFVSATGVCFEFWLVHWNVCVLGDWPEWLLWLLVLRHAIVTCMFYFFLAVWRGLHLSSFGARARFPVGSFPATKLRSADNSNHKSQPPFVSRFGKEGIVNIR